MANDVVVGLLGGMAGFMLGNKKQDDTDLSSLLAQLEMVGTMLDSTTGELTSLRSLNAQLTSQLKVLESLPSNVAAIEVAAVRDALASSYERIEFLTDYIRTTLSVDLTGTPSYEVPIVNGLHVDVNRVYVPGKADPWLYAGANGDIRPRGAHIVAGNAKLRYQDSAGNLQEVPLCSALARFDMITQNIIAGKRFNLDVWNPEMLNVYANGFTRGDSIYAGGGMQMEDVTVPPTGKVVVNGWTLIEFDESIDVVALLKTLRIVMNWKYYGTDAAKMGQPQPFVVGEAITNADSYVFSNIMIPVRRNVLLVQRQMNHYGAYNGSGIAMCNAFTAVGDAMLKIRSANLIWLPYGVSSSGYAHSAGPNSFHQLQLQTPQSGKTFVA